ncbi:class I SAM-dependent methyltransferase [Marinibactrum halimedae]|uniref:Methyltransferase domain-containing protein n=1 Tax=Marinibactrum halimedae TaxID=1444977 RepID=A0AA37WPX8_9GAMM|nr:methyltransferase domain-containing protein [Marinibactrum halimedae]MCD9460940.1 methyltransferase [Marinibactrum halimedae]GLS27411.1 hypothetical protein GCM10007877_31300 [Marinibactrum halimedae]
MSVSQQTKAYGIKHGIKKVRGVYVMRKKNPALRKLRKRLPPPSIHGHRVWSSSFLIMDYLKHYPIDDGAKVMDIGCGWGMLSVYCAKTYNAKVTAVDADRWVFPYLRVHAAMNQVKVKTKQEKYQKLKRKTLAKQDFIAGGDICFWDNLVEPLYKMIKKAVEEGVPYIIVADPGRPPFLRLAKRCKKKFGAELVPWRVDDPKTAAGYLMVIRK